MKELTGITIFTDDINKTTVFYKDLFGFDPIEITEMSATFYFGSFKFFIHKKHEAQEDSPPSEDHLEFKVHDVDKATEELQNEGYELLLAPKEYYWGYSAYLRDHDGRVVELHSGIENHE